MQVKIMTSSEVAVPIWELIFTRMSITWFFCYLYMRLNGVEDPLLGPKGIRKWLVVRGKAATLLYVWYTCPNERLFSKALSVSLDSSAVIIPFSSFRYPMRLFLHSCLLRSLAYWLLSASKSPTRQKKQSPASFHWEVPFSSLTRVSSLAL